MEIPDKLILFVIQVLIFRYDGASINRTQLVL